MLVVTYNGGDRNRKSNVLVNGVHLATEELKKQRPGEFFVKRYKIPAAVLSATPGGKVIIQFTASEELASGVFDIRLIRSDEPDRETSDADLNTCPSHFHLTKETISCSKERI